MHLTVALMYRVMKYDPKNPWDAGSDRLVLSAGHAVPVALCERRVHTRARVLDDGGRICTATDSEWIIRHRQPLASYFPETIAPEIARYPRIARLKERMAHAGFDEIVEHTVEYTYPITDIQIYRDKAFSALHLISEQAFTHGIARMERDLEFGPITCTPRYTLLWGTKR